MTTLRLLTLEILGSSLLRLGIFLVGASFLVARSAQWSGLFVWENRANASMTSLAVLVPLITGIAALDATRIRRFGLGRTWRLSEGSGVRAVAVVIAAQWLLSVTVFVTTVTVAHLPIGVDGVPAGGPSVVWLVAGCAACILGASLGLALGFLVPFLPTVIAAPVATYVGFVALFLLPVAESNHGMARLSPLYQVVVDPFFALDWKPFIGQGIWFALAAGALAAVAVVRVAARRPTAWAALLLVASASITVGTRVASDDSTIVQLRQANGFDCRGEKPVLCLTPEFEPARDRIHKSLGDARARVAGLPLAFDQVEVRPRGTEATGSPRVLPLHVDDLSGGWAAHSKYEMFDRILDPEREYCRGIPLDPRGDPFESARVVLLAWASGDVSGQLPEYDLSSPLDEFGALSQAERAKWLVENRRGVCSGLLTAGSS